MSDFASLAHPKKAAEMGNTPTTIAPRGPNLFKWGESVPFERLQAVQSLEIQGASLTLTCQTRTFVNATTWTHETSMHQFNEDKDSERGLANLEITFWSDEVFRIRFGRDPFPTQSPSFPPKESRMLVGEPDSQVQCALEEVPGGWVVRSRSVELHIEREPLLLWASDREGHIYWQQKRNDLFTSDIFDISITRSGSRTGCFESFSLDGQEEIFGLGERFDGVPRTGRVVDFWNKDAIGTSNRRTYINVPFFFSTRGYGLFLNSSARTEWEIGTLEAFTLGFAIEDEIMDYFIIYGPRPADILYRYHTLTSFAPVPPVWSFGLWMSRCSYLNWDMVHEVADGLRQGGIPADVLHIDFWFDEDMNCDLRFSQKNYPEPEKHIRQLREQGFHLSLWQWNYVPPKAKNLNYAEGLAKGYFAKSRDGGLFAHPPEAKGVWVNDAIIDFSNPAAAEWYAAQIRNLIRLGVGTIKTDFGEGIPEDAVYQNIDGKKFHNLYPLPYNAAIARAIHDVSGEWIVWARSGTAGSQRFPVQWGGDSQCSFGGLAGTLRAALAVGLSGIPFFSHDIGGFIGRPEPELYVRWAQFGLFSSHSRCHGVNPREPWTFGEEACDIFKQYDMLRYRLLPYIYDQARKCSTRALPMVRALVIEYPEDRNVWHIQDQYLFGDAFLVAPVLRPGAEAQTRILYLPAGIWIDYWTKKAIHSHGEWIERPIDLRTMPIYVKAGSILPYGEARLSTGNRVGPITELEIYAGADSRLDYDDGEKSFAAVWQGSKLDLRGLPPSTRVTRINLNT